jgi:hypothetical protein
VMPRSRAPVDTLRMTNMRIAVRTKLEHERLRRRASGQSNPESRVGREQTAQKQTGRERTAKLTDDVRHD